MTERHSLFLICLTSLTMWLTIGGIVAFLAAVALLPVVGFLAAVKDLFW